MDWKETVKSPGGTFRMTQVFVLYAVVWQRRNSRLHWQLLRCCCSYNDIQTLSAIEHAQNNNTQTSSMRVPLYPVTGDDAWFTVCKCGCITLHTQHGIVAFFLCLCGFDLLFVSLCGSASCPGCEPTFTPSYHHPECSWSGRNEMKFHLWYLCDHKPTTWTWT